MAQDSKTQGLYSSKDIWCLLIFAAVLLFLCQEFFLAPNTIFDRDTSLWEIPTRLLYVKLLKEGNFALWTEAYGNGQPFLANLKNAVFYPSSLFYIFLPFFLAFKFHYFFHALVGWLGFYYLGKSYLLSKKASFFGASLFILSGIYLSSFEFYNHIAALAWMPWILFCLRRDTKRFIPRLVTLTVLWSLTILSGTPEVVLLTLVLGLLQSFFLSPKRKTVISLAVLSFSLSLLISAAQIYPSFELWKKSDRRSAETSEWPLEVIQLINLPFPHILGNDREAGHNDYWAGYLFDREYPLYYSFYVGFGALILFFFALKKPFDRLQIFLLISLGLFLLVALGKYSPFYFMSQKIPLFSSIRFPVKFIVGSFFSFSILASIGFDKVFAINSIKRNSVYFLFFLSCLSMLVFSVFQQRIINFLANIFFITSESSLKELRGCLRYGLGLFVLYATIFLLFALSKRRSPFFSSILIGMIIVDLAYCNRSINPAIPTALLLKKPIFLENIKTPIKIYRQAYPLQNLKKENRNIQRVLNYYLQSLYPYCGIDFGVSYLFNEDELRINPSDYQKLVSSIEKCSGEDLLKILRTHGCQYYIGHGPLPNLPFYAENVEGFIIYFQKITETAPPVYIVYNSIKACSLEDKLQALLNKNFNPSTCAIVERDVLLTPSTPHKNRDIILCKESAQGRKRYFVSVVQPAMVVFQDNSDSEWKAWIDNKSTDIFKVNLAAKGILVPSGRHEIELRYLPRSFVLGIIVSLFSLIILGGLILYEILNRKRKR